MSIPLVCIGLLALLVFALGFRVSMARAKERTMYEYTADPQSTLYKAVRAHGNATEYVPTIALLIYILSTMQIASWVLWCMVLITLFRYLAAAGILFPQTLAKPNPMRFIGALGTYIAGFGLCIALLLKALSV
jgi:uncharacterized membrane protein YecN with MAPEG domain